MITSVLERVVLRGIQGVLEDDYMEQFVKDPIVGTLENFYECRYKAQQIYASWKGWA